MSTQAASNRLLALDVFRGFTILAMIIVNSPNTYGELSHAYWDGIYFADLVFPFFILISGVAISLGFKHLPDTPSQRKEILLKVARRTLMLFGLGLIVNLFYTDFAQIRILGVLQRIALVYGCCCVLALYCSTSQMIKTGIGLLVAYWLFVLLVPAPGLPAGQLERGENIINWFDQFMPGMLWRGNWDPEGLLSTFPSIVTGIMGMLIGRILLNHQQQRPIAVMNLFVFGFISFCLGCIWSLWFPFIKQIWSSSFVLATGGLGAMILATMMWYTDVKLCRIGTRLPVIFGANAIAAYVLHVILEKVLHWTGIHEHYVELTLQVGFNAFWSATLWIVLFLLLCWIPIGWLYKKQLFLKV